jgi:hypothetical protein
MIVRSARPKDKEFSPSIINLLSSKNVANLERIECNVLEPILLRLLACKDEKLLETSDDCPYPDHKNSGAVKLVCNTSEDKLAHIYIRNEKTGAESRSYVIIFVEGNYLSETDELMERLQNSVSWLDIAHERPYFYIFYYGQPQYNLTATDSCNRISERMRKLFPGYSKNENICIPASVMKRSKSLIVAMDAKKRISLRAS